MWHLLNYRGMNGNAAIILRAGEELLKSSKTAKCPSLDACLSLLEVVRVVESWAWPRQWGHGWMLWWKWRWGKGPNWVSASGMWGSWCPVEKQSSSYYDAPWPPMPLVTFLVALFYVILTWWTSGVLCMWFYSLLFSFICFYFENFLFAFYLSHL